VLFRSKGAKKYNTTVWEIALEFEEYFWRSMDLIGNVRPDVSCRATEHIEAQLEMVKTLEEKGFAYVIEGDGVYFDTSKLDDYGKLAQLDLEHLQEGARVEMIAGKRNPTDFALWKFERSGENRAMVWESPWHPRSFPGWHIECSAMSMQYLGEQFEIHTGGIDHIPVHHTNEIAQAEAATGKKPFVKIWVHHNHLHVDGVKMSKSLGNFYTIDDVLERGFTPQALRLLFLSSHYRSEQNFTWENLAGMQKAWDRLVRQVAGWKQKVDQSDPGAEAPEAGEKLQAVGDLSSESEGESAQLAEGITERFWKHMEHDLATPEAVAVLWEVAKSTLTDGEKLRLLTEFDEVLGLGIDAASLEFTAKSARAGSAASLEIAELPFEIQQLVRDRQAARASKDFTRSDQLRDQLLAAGFTIKDTPDGQQLSRNV
jgi:cysteinyl-tRNA synthetase